jgi:hypothetical protein
LDHRNVDTGAMKHPTATAKVVLHVDHDHRTGGDINRNGLRFGWDRRDPTFSM